MPTQPSACPANAATRDADQQPSRVDKAAASLGCGALALMDQSLAALVGTLGETGFDVSSVLASGLWSHLFSTL